MRKFVFSSLFQIFFSSVFAQNLPPLNQKIWNFAHQNLNKQVGRGECWDLAATPLNEFNAKWDKKFEFGKRINPEKDKVLPGDIIQFENVVLTYQIEDAIIKETMSQHTAIVYKVLDNQTFEIAHQNTSEWGKIVKTSRLALKDLNQGKLIFYRPQP